MNPPIVASTLLYSKCTLNFKPNNVYMNRNTKTNAKLDKIIINKFRSLFFSYFFSQI